ncbi:NAD(P)-dependent oxidoreductase [Brachybacterium sp. P6-10-X1]|uniref:NAD(P)H-binding protein n=1 Tax=Brachybacterium sp. P6-10-X1 TaxID=1903186 RepID=UPI0009718F85|nr:NAD(P)H-binding protein [Brachybacterium sp. P6-10-X1]APX33182.1 NAD(P)-dependent oxidoreductase [Brachybacterium sp. P6-10-X1]
MIVITGATGALGGAVTDHLLEHLPAERIAVVAREPARARRFADRGVEVRRGDYAEPGTLPSAFAGADQLLLVSSSDPAADAVALHRAAIEGARHADVGRILYTSHQGAAADSPFPPARDHAATEAILADSGLAWTALRNGFYAHSLPGMLGSWRETGMITVPAEGPVSWTAREDSAEAAAKILLASTPVDGPVTITAEAAPTFEEVADIATRVTGESIAFAVQDPQAWVEEKVAAGTPEFLARFSLGVYEAAAGGYLAGTDPALHELLGRAPRSVADCFAADRAETGAGRP